MGEERSDGLLLRYHNGDKSRKAILSAIEVARARVCAVFECPEEVRITIYADHMHVCQIVVHEYAHFVTSNIAAELPKWLIEGLAVYLAIQNDEGRVADAYRTGKLIPIEELEEKWLEDPGLAYSEAVVEDVTGKTLRQLDDEWIRSVSDKK